MLPRPAAQKRSRRENAGVTFVATLVILVIYAGFAAVLQAKATAKSSVLIELSSLYDEQLIEDSARAGLLPKIAQALLDERIGQSTELNLAGEVNLVEFDGRTFSIHLTPQVDRRKWNLEVTLQN